MKTKLTRSASAEIQKSVRHTFKATQRIAENDKENIVGKSFNKELGIVRETDYSLPTTTLKQDQSTQTEQEKITADNLTSDSGPGEHYWERLAEVRYEELITYIHANDNLISEIEELKKENDELTSKLESALLEIENNKVLIEKAARMADIVNGIFENSQTAENNNHDNSSGNYDGDNDENSAEEFIE